MTTVIHIERDFVASDSKWSTETGLTVLTPISKYLYNEKSIVYYAGSEFAIVSSQALLKKIISKTEYKELLNEQINNGDSLEFIAIDVNDGSIKAKSCDCDGVGEGEDKVLYLGTGGLYAASFFYYAKKSKYRTMYGNNNVEGALRYAFQRDKCYSGEPICIKSWNNKYPIDSTINNDNVFYDHDIKSRLEELKMYVQHKRISYTNSPVIPKQISSLSSSLGFAYSPNQPLLTGSLSQRAKITPERAKRILESLSDLLED